ncbi:hypothetical protein DEU56DRAFT_337196 [Suillus clintonianus]|uniref:uncharacterized protein n=1 Tax=Suillus clintonianus TaxID=1904413 RepID=UPI001B87D80D|nr:uncharacterized protein DEU56DRAFT_337196 [Suillus clintonianus]KAG2138523.1 hypothetical protein DEU56DRAFT_337196 [Suillus clintonianus]
MICAIVLVVIDTALGRGHLTITNVGDEFLSSTLYLSRVRATLDQKKAVHFAGEHESSLRTTISCHDQCKQSSSITRERSKWREAPGRNLDNQQNGRKLVDIRTSSKKGDQIRTILRLYCVTRLRKSQHSSSKLSPGGVAEASCNIFA